MTASLLVPPARTTRTGRPYRPPEERVAPEAAVVDRRLRTAWLLGTSRTLAADGAFTQRREFVAALNARGITCDSSRVSRWESGALPVSTTVIEAYEELLGLAPYQLRGAVDLVRLPGTPPYGVTLPADTTESHERLDELLSAALNARADGLQWLELAQRITSTEAFYLRETEWQTLTRTLVTEYCRAIGTGHLARATTLGQLIAYPRAQRHLLRAIGEVVLDERVAHRGKPVHLLSIIAGPHTSLLALRLAESNDPPVRAQATRTLAALAADGTFDESLVPSLVEMLVRQLRQDPAATELADVAVRLPRFVLDQVQAAVRSKTLHQVISTHELVSREIATACAREVAEVANPASARARIEADGMLARLVRDGLFHAHFRRRTAALSILAASPYADRVADGLTGLLDHADGAVTHHALEAMSWFVRDRHAAPLVAIAGSSRPAAERRLALTALGHLPSAPPAGVLDVALACVSDPADEVSRSAVAMLGMHGRADAVSGTDPLAAAAARWWLDEGPRLSR